jgi:hypothetical protein
MPAQHARSAAGPASDWLRGPTFDLGLIGGVLVLALVLGGLASASPRLFTAVLVLDLWLLAYPHVASTFTRVAFDRASARRHWFLLLALPPIVLLATAGMYRVGGFVALSSLYYYWQSWHYTRQSHGIARAYHRAAGLRVPDRLDDAVILAFPLWGVLHRVYQQPGEFYQVPLWTPAIPGALVVLAGSAALGLLLVWSLRYVRAARSSPPRSLGHALFVLSHVAITVVSYLVISDVTRGWLFINIWHNAQYLLFVWAMNARRFAAGIDPRRPFLSAICQPTRVGHYALTCLALSTGFYLLLGQTPEAPAWSPLLPLLLVCHMAVNFHHYLVDAVIWGSRARSRP